MERAAVGVQVLPDRTVLTPLVVMAVMAVHGLMELLMQAAVALALIEVFQTPAVAVVLAAAGLLRLN
jgi:hypothetical protein